MSQTTPAVEITPAQLQQFHDEGYFILERVLTDAQLASLRSECQRFIAAIDEDMDRQGVEVQGINHKGKRYFVGGRHKQSQALRTYLYSDLMAAICRATLGDEAYLFVEQYVVKAAEVGMKFAWHQDSGYIGHDHRPYLSCWTTLDDVNEDNGTVYILPYSRAGTKTWVCHEREAGTNDMIGYRGDDPGIPIVAPAGSIAVFSSTTFHRSGPNTTKQPRRVYLSQYSAEPIMSTDGSKLWSSAVPLLKAGRNVADPQTSF